MLDSDSNTIKELFPPQREILDHGLLSGRDHWVISMPTGSGKTLLGEWVLLNAVEQGFKGVYLSPLKAIAEEKYRDWQARYPHIRFGVFTGDALKATKTPNPAAVDVLICTPERFDAYLRSWKRTITWVANIDVCVIDELHLLHQGSRGARLEALITRATRLNPFIRMIGLSATLANLDELAEWLHARRYCSSWRLVPVTKRVRRFSKPADKPRMLLEEIQETTLDKGKVLVFVNSRKRAESLAKHLQQSDICATFHHAGLPRGERLSTEAAFRNGPVDVLIATSTLEMGLNLPARKVVLYDSYAFADNGSFEALPVINYVQRTGRAGRPGLDTEGESVFFLPAWTGNSKCYDSEEVEPILSTLFDENLLAGQVLAEISSRIAITRTQLEMGFGDRTLWRFQGGKHRLDNVIDLLARSAMIKETAREGIVFLSATAIGRLGTQLFLSPKSILAIKNCYVCCDSLFLFDLLLITSLLPECEPRLWFDFEEIDSFGDQLLSIPSFLLDQSQSFLRQCFGQGEERHLLSALKMAALLHGRILGLTDEELMDAFSCYASDIHFLVENAGWLIGAVGALYSALRAVEIGDSDQLKAFYEARRKLSPLPEDLCRQLLLRVRYGLSAKMVPLASIQGVGGVRAKRLWDAGFRDPEDISLAEPEAIATIPGFGLKSARTVIKKAEHVVKMDCLPYEEDQIERSKTVTSLPTGVDPYRLRRALDLRIDKRGQETAVVTGGSEPRRVTITRIAGKREYHCECPDFAKRQLPCKHILRVQMEYAEGKQLYEALRSMQQVEDSPLRHSIGHLWMKVKGSAKKTSGGERKDSLVSNLLQRSCRKRR